jgi:methylated-DNA-protein-cysteine methyltransferase related protein
VTGTRDSDDYAEAVLELVERIPAGRVMSYGAIAEVVGWGGPRQVGTVMSRYGGGVPWHRVVNSVGRLVPGHEVKARRLLLAEGVPFRGDRVDMRRAAWFPEA